MIYLVHATKNEVGLISGGEYGDQTGLEVVKQEFFEYEWEYIFRPVDKVMADRLAAKAEIIAANENIGYGQAERYTMYLEAKKLGWDFAAIEEPCATDCSQMIATLCISEGLNVSPYMYTGNEKGALSACGAFTMIKYTPGKTELKKADILLTTKRGHTAIITSTNEPSYIPKWVGEAYGVQFVPVYKKADENSGRAEWGTLGAGNLFDVCDADGDFYFIRIAGQYFGYIRRIFVLRKTPDYPGLVRSAVNVRQNAGSQYKKLGTLEKDTSVEICDTKKAANGSDWFYITYKDGWGFVSAKYVRGFKLDVKAEKIGG